MPVLSRIACASPDGPYLALIASIDRDVLARVSPPADAVVHAEADPFALRVGEADVDLLDAFARYLRVLQSPEDAEVLAPLVVGEIHYRVMRSPQGHALRRLVTDARPAAPVARAIELIRENLATHLSIGSLARELALSPSALHHHFKAVTGTTPIQFQKQLRLLEARRLIRAQSHSVTDAAYTVGYTSATQFSREYRRAFGHPPSTDRPPRLPHRR